MEKNRSTRLFRRLPAVDDHAEHRVDVQRRNRDADPAIAAEQRHEQRKCCRKRGKLREIAAGKLFRANNLGRWR